jgi:serine phosphatase RsbU (regulator of sigma subunit)
MYTDGLLDAHAPAVAHRTADVAAALSSCTGLTARETVARIERALLDMDDARPRDDIAILVLRRS